jgi:hypothetical protein
MTVPVIDSITPPGPLTLAPGQQVVFTVAAHDPDTRTGSATFTVTDGAGNVSTGSAAFTVVDPLTYTATTTTGTITQDPVNPTKFTLQV